VGEFACFPGLWIGTIIACFHVRGKVKVSIRMVELNREARYVNTFDVRFFRILFVIKSWSGLFLLANFDMINCISLGDVS
jgi:hypothetical protein